MATLWQDVRYGLRMLRKHPGFTAIALITLAIGIGANTIMFSVADVLLLRPVGVKEPERLLCCGISDFRIGHAAYLAIRQGDHAFSDVMAQDEGLTRVTLTDQNFTGRGDAMFVSGNYFSFLGVAPAQGRGLRSDDDRLDAPPVVVLNHSFWQRQGEDPAMVGRSLHINGVPCQIVGIAPKGFTGTAMTGPDLWLPMSSYLATMVFSRGEARPAERYRDLAWYPRPIVPVGRLKPGLSESHAQASLEAMAPSLKAQFHRHWRPRSTPYVYPVPRISQVFGKRERSVMKGASLFLMGVSAVILIIGCLNLANMLIIRGTSRGHEIAIRLALGGGRLRIIRQLLVESLLLALLGCICGLFLAFWGTRILNVWMATSQRYWWKHLQVGLSIRTLGFAFCVSAFATLLFGLRPALGLSRRDLVGELKQFGSAIPRPAKRRRGGLSVLCQTALAVALVMVAAMFARRLLLLVGPTHNLDLENTLVLEVDPLSAGYDQAGSAEICETLVDHLESLPGVEAVGMSPSFSFGGGGIDTIYKWAPEPGGGHSEKALAQHAGSLQIVRDYFPSVGLTLLQGRPFNHLDRTPDAEKVVIVDETIARKLAPDGHALGALIRFGWFSDRSEPYRVVGIAPRIPGSPGGPTFAQTYTPLEPTKMCPYFYLRLKNRRSAQAMKQGLAELIGQVDSRVPVLSVATLEYRRRDHGTLWFAGICARLTGIAGATALFLAALGIFAVKGYLVASRTREIGIRKALGATRGNIMGIVLREGLALTLLGLVIGVFLGLGMTRTIATVLHGYEMVGLAGIAVTIVLLGLVSLLAAYIPARRAARIHPMTALRCE